MAFLLLTLNIFHISSSASIVDDFEQINVRWVLCVDFLGTKNQTSNGSV